jgi:hypothetical protein
VNGGERVGGESGEVGSLRGKGRSKGLMKRVLWVRSMGKGSKVGDVKGLVLGSGEAERSAEKNNEQNVLDWPMGVEFGVFGKCLWDGPMGRGEWFGNWGVRGYDSEDVGGKAWLGGGK